LPTTTVPRKTGRFKRLLWRAVPVAEKGQRPPPHRDSELTNDINESEASDEDERDGLNIAKPLLAAPPPPPPPPRNGRRVNGLELQINKMMF